MSLVLLADKASAPSDLDVAGDIIARTTGPISASGSTRSDFDLSVLLDALDYFDIQKAAFKSIPPLLLAPFAGLWVASVDGVIVDNDRDLQTLSRRFFDSRGDIDVYITKVDARRGYRVRTPFQR